jgi:hypothetical protein
MIYNTQPPSDGPPRHVLTKRGVVRNDKDKQCSFCRDNAEKWSNFLHFRKLDTEVSRNLSDLQWRVSPNDAGEEKIIFPKKKTSVHFGEEKWKN